MGEGQGGFGRGLGVTLFLISWAFYACPGGLFSGFVPMALKPVACELRVDHAIRTNVGDMQKVLDNDVPEVAPNTKVAVVSRIKDGRLKDLEVKTEHKIEGRD